MWNMQKIPFKRICAGLLAVTMLGSFCMPEKAVFAAPDVVADETKDPGTLKICVISDAHYYPLNYISDCEDYRTYVGGDPKMLGESGAILDSAIEMIRQDAPDVVLVSGDLTKDGEKQGHEEFAAKLQKIEDETDTEVFVIDGNHDIYNYEDSCTFQNGKKESTQTVTPQDFRQLYGEFGYNGEYQAQYYTPPTGKQAGGLSYSVIIGDYMILAIDSGRYSPDSNGLGKNEHITAGRIDEDLLPWLKGQIERANSEGKTVIGLMHHALVPHFSKEAELLNEYVVDNWKDMASELADAGMRYIFTGHMHANDIAEYTTVKGNKIYDLETGSLAAYGSPVRTVTVTRSQEQTADAVMQTNETFQVNSKSVKSIQYQGQNIDDLQAYTMEKLYPKNLFQNMADGMLKPMLKEIGNQGIRSYLAEKMPDLDINTTVLSTVQDMLAGGMTLEFGNSGRVAVDYRDGGIELKPSGFAGVLGDTKVSDAQIISIVDDLLAKVENQYLKDPTYLMGKIDGIVEKVSNFGVASLNGEEKTLYDFVTILLTSHYAGGENPPAWVTDEALPYLKSGAIIKNLIEMLVVDVSAVANEMAGNLSVNTGIAFSSTWKWTIDSQTNNGNLASILDMFGLNVEDMINGLISEYMSDSFLTGMGGLIDDYAESFLYDTESQDDILDDPAGRTISYSTETPIEPQKPSVENGLSPTQISMTQGESPDVRYVRWYTGVHVEGTAQAQISETKDFNAPITFRAESETVVKPKTLINLGLMTTYTTQKAKKYTAKLSGLETGKTYYYRVGVSETENWSTPVTFTVKNEETSGFTFINVNDSQGMIKSDYDTYLNTLAEAKKQFDGAAFVLHSGDFVDDGSNEDYWTWALDGVSESVSYMPSAGNHEARSNVQGVTDANPIVSHFEVQKYDMPEDQDKSTGVYYSYVYQNATFIVLNTNDLTSDGYLSEKQYDWAYQTAKDADTDWKIILMHKSPYSNGPHGGDDDVKAIRQQINALTAECDVDLVLSGHDHVYNRTPYLSQGKEEKVTTKTTTYQGMNYETAINPSGTVFAIAGTAGVKTYVQTSLPSVPSAVTFQQTCPVYAGVTIDNGKLYYRAYEVKDGVSKLMDSFAIDKSGETEVPNWKKVEDLIAAIPKMVTLQDQGDVQAARTAYDALTAEERAQVDNVELLLEAEKQIRAMDNISKGRSVTVDSRAAFVNAIKDTTVNKIIVQGEIQLEGSLSTGDRDQYITRDLEIGGTGVLTLLSLHVQNGATLILSDFVSIDDVRTAGSDWLALNPVEVDAGSTLITKDHASLRTEWGAPGWLESNGDRGFCVKLIGDGSEAILGSKGDLYAAESAVIGTSETSKIVIHDGTYERKNDRHRAVDSVGIIEIDGGTIRNLGSSGTLYINGGTFDNGSQSSPQIPIYVEGTAYITGGDFKPYNGQSLDITSSGKVHMLASAIGQIQLGAPPIQPYVGSVATSDYKNVTVNYHNLSGYSSYDGIYTATGPAVGVEALAAANGTKLTSSHMETDGEMKATLTDGDYYLYGKYYLAGGGKQAPSTIKVASGGEAIVYGPTRFIENHAVESAVIEGEKTRVVRYNEQGTTVRLNGYTSPANAFDNAVTWSSSDESVATVSRGAVTLKNPGTAVITMTSDANPNIRDSVTFLVVDPKIEGEEQIDQKNPTAQYTVSGVTDTRISYEWSVDNMEVAVIDKDTGVLTKNGSGKVKVTARLLLDGVATDVTVSKDVIVMETISVEVTWGAMEFTYHNGTWNKDTHTYDGRGWTTDAQDGDLIHVANTGDTKVNAAIMYTQKAGNETISGAFVNEDGVTLGSGGITLQPKEAQGVEDSLTEMSARLILNGKPNGAKQKSPVGNVTIRIDRSTNE